MGQQSGGYPLDYLAAGLVDDPTLLEQTKAVLDALGLVATQKREPFPGQVARVKIDAYGESASEVEQTLREYGSRCDLATQAPECGWGQFVIERSLTEEDGKLYSWKGRLTLHPTLGAEPFVPAGRLLDALPE